MRAVVLAGGYGLRLRPYTTVLPKPLVPVGDRPVLEHILRRLAAAGVVRADLCVSHLGGLIQAYFSQAGTLPHGLELAWHWEEQPLGTAGALRMIPDLDETFIAVNGDLLTTVDFKAIVDHHRSQQAALTIATQERGVPLDLGVIECVNGDIVAYREKPTLRFVASLGIYVYDPRALRHLPDGPAQFPDFVQALLRAGERVVPFPSGAQTFDIGTVEQHAAATRALAEHPLDFLTE
jgi:NDP-sugar pyrophosphorylase family protein